jgi:Uma2 family endonuclease
MVTAERSEAAGTATAVAAKEVWEIAPEAFPFRLRLPSDWELTDERFFELCSVNEGWRIETDCEGVLLIMAPTGPDSSDRGGRIYSQTLIWSDTQARGRAFESSATFMLPNGDRRMPDAAWISDERLAEVAGDEHIIWRICPDFVVEVRSESDRLAPQQVKMEMWISQGARLGWLIDPLAETVWIYRPGQEPEQVERPESLTATEIADDLVIDFSRIWPDRKARDGHG